MANILSCLLTLLAKYLCGNFDGFTTLISESSVCAASRNVKRQAYLCTPFTRILLAIVEFNFPLRNIFSHVFDRDFLIDFAVRQYSNV